MSYIDLTSTTIADEHICCAISDKKCAAGYQAKKDWLAAQFEQGYVFRRLDERAKVFIEYGPAEKAWVPVEAPNWLMLGCFWVSGRFKGDGHGKALLESAVDEAKRQGKAGIVAVVGAKKFHFMSDGKWLLRNGFVEVDRSSDGFILMALPVPDASPAGVTQPSFGPSVRNATGLEPEGITVYYSDRCPFAGYHVETSLTDTAAKRGLSLTVHKLDTLDAARNAPTPATIFSLYLDGRFVTTDISACMDSRFDKVVQR